jgi:hypothetical protein
MKRPSKKAQAVSRLILRYLVSDFRDRNLGTDALRDGYEGIRLCELKQTFIEQHRVSAVDFDLAVDELENGEFIRTGPMEVYDNPLGSTVLILGVFSKREHVCIAEKGYKMIDGDDFGFPDRVDVLTNIDGSWHKNIKAQVQRDKVLLLESKLPITEGDILRRTLPNELTEEYAIEHVEFQDADMDFPAMMTAHVRKRGSALHDRQRGVSRVNYNLTGANSRININSVDNSVNTLTENSPAVFSELADAITAQVQDANFRLQLAAAIREMNETCGTAQFTGRFQEFMALAANCMTVVMPFVPALSQLLK